MGGDGSPNVWRRREAAEALADPAQGAPGTRDAVAAVPSVIVGLAAALKGWADAAPPADHAVHALAGLASGRGGAPRCRAIVRCPGATAALTASLHGDAASIVSLQAAASALAAVVTAEPSLRDDVAATPGLLLRLEGWRDAALAGAKALLAALAPPQRAPKRRRRDS